MSILKRTIVIILSVLTIAVASATAMAETSFSDGEFEFIKTDKGNGIITSCELTDADITVPEFVLDYPIAGIGDCAFMSMPFIKSISMPLSVVSIGEYAFAENPQQFRVNIPKYCDKIASTAFSNSPNVIIVGYEDTFAKTFADNNNLCFEPVKAEHTQPVTKPTETNPTEESQPATEAELTTSPGDTTEPTEPGFSEGTTPTQFTHQGFTEDATTAETYQPSSPVDIMPVETTDPPTDKISAPKLNKTALKLKAGNTACLKVTGAKVKSWKSSQKTVAAVKNGKVTALRKGKSNIVVTLTNGKKLTCKVTVTTSPAIKVGNKKYSKKTTYLIKHGKKLAVSIVGKAKSAGNKYKTTNKKIAKIISGASAEKAVIRAYKKGKATITLKVNGVSFAIKIKVL